ncbi:MAG: hypothetical protein Q9216_004557 [Gyalolechia sp. 2 TL-2023]
MSDPPEDKKTSIPQWQRQGDPEPEEDPDHSSTLPETSTPAASPPRATLLAQASKFLDEDEIKDAPEDRKIAFLETKGLTQEEISKLLDRPSESADAPPPKEAGTEETTETAPSPQSSSSAEKDITPIITYPEFLVHSRKPPPLVTASGLINTFYVFSGTAAAIYGTSKYIVDPMLDSLTSARHSLFETAQTNLDTLNEKLTKNVSTVPDGMANQSQRDQDDDEEKDDSSETTEDITPLFNRTIGTQTSSPPSPPSPSSSISGPEPKPPPKNCIPIQETSLKSLHSSLSTLRAPPPSTSSAGVAQSNLSSEIRDFKQYLDRLSYPSLYPSSATTTASLAESKDDAVNKFKAEVRGVKGVLLSARNFPSGTGRAVG